jgi:hypothetical protein
MACSHPINITKIKIKAITRTILITMIQSEVQTKFDIQATITFVTYVSDTAPQNCSAL